MAVIFAGKVLFFGERLTFGGFNGNLAAVSGGVAVGRLDSHAFERVRRPTRLRLR
jgi:drug/metabolite transporter (DMT)-like permease